MDYDYGPCARGPALDERRQARATLRSMTDYELRDLGVSRTAIEAALRRYEGNPDDYPESDKHPTDI